MLTVEEVVARIEGLSEILTEPITVAHIQGQESDVSSISEDGSVVTVQALLDFLFENESLDTLFGGSSTAELVDGELFITAPQGSKG